MKSQQLLSRLERLDYGRRQGELARLARELDPSVLESLFASLQEGLYEAQAALTLASVARRGDLLLQAFQWPWPQTRQRAATLLVDLQVLPEDLVPAALGLDLRARRVFLAKIRRRGCSLLADALIKPFHQRHGLRESRLLMPALSPELLADWLEKYGYRLDSWRSLSGRHPDLVLGYWRGQLKAKPPENRARSWYSLSSALDVLALKRPQELLGLAREFGEAQAIWSVFRPIWGRLLSVDSEAVLRLLQGAEYQALWKAQGLPSALISRLRRFALEEQVTLMEPFAADQARLSACLQALAPKSRARAFVAATAGTNHSQTRWGQAMMRTLPHELRAAEARRMLALPSVMGRLEETLSVLGFHPPEEARPKLRELAKNPKVDLRALARRQLLESPGFYRQQISEALSDLAQWSNEPDPVRNAALTALNQWPHCCWSHSTVEPLRGFLKDICQAQDTSESTRHLFRQLALRWIEHCPVGSAHFQFGLECLRELTDSAAVLFLPSIRNFPRERRQAIIDATVERVDYQLKREDASPLFALCRALGSRLEHHPEIEARLAPLTRNKHDWCAFSAISFWLKGAQTRDERVEKLLSQEPSAIVVYEISQHVHRRRQDLLGPVLQRKPIKGRFLSGQTIFVPPFNDGFDRWLPKQQQAFAELHLLIVKDEKRRLMDRARSLSLFREFCFLDDSWVLPYLADPELSLREAALAALNRNPDQLIAKLNQQEARVAAFRLANQLRALPPAQARALLRQALEAPTKLTSKKELLRLAGVLGERELLEQAWQERGQHRDLKLALLQALLTHFDQDWARTLYAQAFSAEDAWLVRTSLTGHRGQVPPDHRASWVEPLMRVLNHGDPTLRNLAWTALREWSEDAPERLARRAVEGVADLEERGWRPALELLLSCQRPGEISLRLVASRLIEKDDWRLEGRDQPARQRLRFLVNRVSTEQKEDLRRRYFEGLSDLDYPESLLFFRVAVVQNDWADLSQKVETFEEMEALTSGVLDEIRRPKWTKRRLLETVQNLAEHSSPVARRLAVEVLKQLGAQTQWDHRSQELLEKLRDDPYQGVSERARLVIVRAEP